MENQYHTNKGACYLKTIYTLLIKCEKKTQILINTLKKSKCFLDTCVTLLILAYVFTATKYTLLFVRNVSIRKAKNDLVPNLNFLKIHASLSL